MKDKDSLRNSWASLGIAFNSNDEKTCADPETAIIELICSGEFPEDKKMMGLALLWLEHFSKLVHVERLKILTKNLGAFETALLGAIARKCVAFGDFRWRMIEKNALAKNTGRPKFAIGDSETFIKMRGLDEDFAAFGIRVGPVRPDDPKKLLNRQTVIKRNIWLRNRLLFGSNVRADVATLKLLNRAQTGYAAAKILGCSPNAAYRNWKDLEDAGWAKFERAVVG